MSVIRTRQEARNRDAKDFFDALGRIIPADESVPLKGHASYARCRHGGLPFHIRQLIRYMVRQCLAIPLG